MKNTRFAPFYVLLLCMLSLSACQKDKEAAPSPADQVAGTYNGFEYSLGNSTYPLPENGGNLRWVVEKQTETTVRITQYSVSGNVATADAMIEAIQLETSGNQILLLNSGQQLALYDKGVLSMSYTDPDTNEFIAVKLKK